MKQYMGHWSGSLSPSCFFQHKKLRYYIAFYIYSYLFLIIKINNSIFAQKQGIQSYNAPGKCANGEFVLEGRLIDQ